MNRYELLERLGGGTFGEVTKARNLKTNEIVAIKKMKALFPSWEECLQLRELKSLRVLRHDNVVQLKEVIRDKEELYFVFEYMQTSLHRVLRQYAQQQPSTSDPGTSTASSWPAHWLSEAQIKSIMYQLFSGLAYMHKHGFFHRDIKPENLLCDGETLKLADLGQAREIRSRPPFTDYVSTRWYRSPELLLRSSTYNSPIDMWACGCIMAELYLHTPIFTGTSEADQLYRIAKVLGTPTKETWPDGVAMAASMVQFKFPKGLAPVPWTHVLPAYISSAARQLIAELLQYDPSKRLTATQALQHRFFDQQVPRAVPLVPVQLPVKAEAKGSVTWEASDKSVGGGGGGGGVTSRWWRESSTSALPTIASHSDGLGRNKTTVVYDPRADAKHGGGGGGGGASGKPVATLYPGVSARKWTSPEVEDDDDDNELDYRHAPSKQHADNHDMDGEGKATPPSHCNRSSSSSSRRPRRDSSFKGQDHQLQDLLDELIA